MATQLAVPVRRLTDGSLGPLCARHGVPADSAALRTFRSRAPRSSWWALPLGVVPLLATMLMSRGIVRGAVPTCRRCRVERTGVRAGCGLGAVAGFALLAVASSTDDLLLGWVGFVLLALTAAGTPFVVERMQVGGRVSEDLQWVELVRVHPRFAADPVGAADAPVG